MQQNYDPASSFGGLYSGRIVQAIKQALDIGEGPMSERTARRFFAGEPVTERNRSEILNALGQALIDFGLIPETLDALPEDVPMSTAVGMAIGLAGERWDHLMADIQSRALPIGDWGVVGVPFLRLAIVDLTLRIFALNRLDSGTQLPQPGTPLWAQENGSGKILRGLARRAGLTRYQLADRLGQLSTSSVDNWLDGNHYPLPDNVSELASKLAPATGQDALLLERELRRQFTLARLADFLAGWIGREEIIDLLSALTRLSRLLSDSIDFPLSGDKYPGHVELRLFLFGCLDEAARPLLWQLAKLEDDPNWKRDLLAAASPWETQFVTISRAHGDPRTSAGLAQDLSDLANDDGILDADPAAEAIRLELSTEMAVRSSSPNITSAPYDILEMLRDGIDRRRRLVRRFPESPTAHFQMGSYLGMAGKHLRARELIDEGVVECWIAAGLTPLWDAPAVEPGIIRANFGDYDGALQELERAQASLPQATPHLRLTMGYTLTMLNRFVEALEHLEEVINIRPDHAFAYRYAAQCAFGLGDKTKGLRYAKAARRYGDFVAYTAWRDGAF